MLKHQISIASFCVMLLLFSGCRKIDEFTKFEMDYEEEVIIPSSTGINLPFNVLTPEMETNSASTFESNNTKKELIEQIILQQLDVTLTSPESSDLSFLNSVQVYLSADGLEEIKVAWKENIPENVGKYLELETSDQDLKEYVKKDQFQLRINTVTDKVITSDHHLDVHSNFFVDAKVLGQ